MAMLIKPSRRHVLAGLGSLAATPFVPVLEALAQPAAPRRRLVIVHTPNGVATQERWRPKGTATDFMLGEIMGPLEPHKRDLIVLDGVRDAAYGSPGGHNMAASNLLTCVRSKLIGGKDMRAQGPSVDQVIAARVGGQTRFPSLQLGVCCHPSKQNNSDPLDGVAIAYKGANEMMLADSDPYAVFERLFAGSSVGTARPTPAGPNETDLDTKSVLDTVVEDLRRLSSRVGQSDRLKLDRHLEGIREIERTLRPAGEGTSPGGVACAPVMLGNKIDVLADGSIPTMTKAQVDLLVTALACDLTRVVTLQFGSTSWTAVFKWLGHTSHNHDLNHSQRHDSTVAAQRWMFEHGILPLINGLKAAKEGDGSVWDHTVFMWLSEFSDGHAHATSPHPVLLGGGAGAWRTGRYLKTTQSQNDVMVSLCHAMGLADVKTFGDPSLCTGPHAGLT